MFKTAKPVVLQIKVVLATTNFTGTDVTGKSEVTYERDMPEQLDVADLNRTLGLPVALNKQPFWAEDYYLDLDRSRIVITLAPAFKKVGDNFIRAGWNEVDRRPLKVKVKAPKSLDKKAA